MSVENDLSDHFLIATPSLQDPHFAKTVLYICEHNEEGAIGLVINSPLDIQLHEVFDQMSIDYSNLRSKDIPILYGGPVAPERGFVLHKPCGEWNSSLTLNDDIAITTSKDILNALATGEGPEDVIIILGYAGWGSEQLEEELKTNAWLSCKASPEIIFKTPYEERWQAAAKLIGVDINKLSGDVGHA